MKNIKKILGVAAVFCIGITSFFILTGESHPSRNENYLRDVLVVGCARSGTTYMTSVFRKCGYRVGHEYLKRNGVCSWEMTVDTEQVPWGHARNGAQFKHIFHQVRHPLKTIASCLGEPPESFVFIRKHLPEITPQDSLLTLCAKYWYYWNLKAEAQAEWTYCIENLETVWNEMEMRLGRAFDKTILKKISKTTNSRGKPPVITWAQLKSELEPQLYENIRVLANKYGYSTEL